MVFLDLCYEVDEKAVLIMLYKVYHQGDINTTISSQQLSRSQYLKQNYSELNHTLLYSYNLLLFHIKIMKTHRFACLFINFFQGQREKVARQIIKHSKVLKTDLWMQHLN